MKCYALQHSSQSWQFAPPLVLFLKYEAKDIIITLGEFIFGPLMSLIVSLIVFFIEMITIGDTAYIGFAMNVLSTYCFAYTAVFIYKNDYMKLFPYTNIYEYYKRSSGKMLVPYILLFNLTKLVKMQLLFFKFVNQ